MATEIKMPQLGESVVEGTITRWLKKEGDTVAEDELLVEVSTDKVDSEVPSSAAGTIQKILVGEGETVKVGTPIAVVGEGSAESSDGAEAAAEPSEDQGEEPSSEQVEDGAQEQPAPEAQDRAPEAQDRPGEAEQGPAEEEEAAAGPEASSDGRAQERPAPSAEEGQPREPQPQRSRETSAAGDGDVSKRGIISPLVRRLADEHGIDLEQVQGTGTGGRIRKQDIMRFVEKATAERGAEPAPAPEAPEPKPAAARPAAASEGQREESVPWTNIRRRTAEHMAASARETARAWNAVEADWTDVVKLREHAKDAFRQREGFNLTYMAFLGRAVCETLLEMPEINATFDEENQANVVKHYVNLGIAVALEGGGLIVPVVKAADEKNLVGLARGINDVVTRARGKKLSPDDLTGGTFTITNPGPFGSILSVPIIPRGQTAILGFETIEKRVVVVDADVLAIRSRGFLSLSWDHRVIDGAEAATFLSRLKDRIETTSFSDDLEQYL